MSYINRPVTRGYYSLPKTRDEWVKAGEDAIKDIPRSHRRVRDEKSAEAQLEYILAKRRAIKTPYKIGDKVAYTKNENWGTKKWPWVITTIYTGYIVKIGEATYTIAFRKDYDPKFGSRVNKEFVLARTK